VIVPVPLTGLSALAGSVGGTFHEDALCAQIDPEIFFPEKGQPGKEAKEMCLRCEVRTACLQWAIDNGEEFGVWGGLTARERKNLLAGNVVDDRLIARLEGIRLPSADNDRESRRLAG